MKRYVILVGGTGARLMDALICGASAGVYPAGTVQVLLADTDQRGVQGAAMLKAHLADYDRIQQLHKAPDGGFRTAIKLHSWPRTLPGGVSTLREMTADTELDALLCQALFDEDAADVDMHEGFHGRRSLAKVTFEGLLHAANQDPDDPLMRMIADMKATAESGEEVRVVFSGSICSGTGAAGIPALMKFIRERAPESVRMGAVLLTACAEQQDAAQAREALTQYAKEKLCETVCILGLPSSSRPTAPAELPRLTDWLAVYCMDVLLHRPTWLTGVFTVQSEEGPLFWSIFGKAGERYRQAYGSLFKTALAWTSYLGPEIERRLEHPFFLRDMFGWYGHYFRRMVIDRQEEMETALSLNRLMRLMLMWLGGLCVSLPLDLRHATVLGQARAEAQAHYDGLTELVSQLSVLDDDLQRNDDHEDSIVYRHFTQESTDSEKTLTRIDAVKAEIRRREAEQEMLQQRMGGASAMTMLEDALIRAEEERDALNARYEEAVRRIDEAEKIAYEEELYRITDARTKLQRMERHRLMLRGRVERIREDVAQANAEERRFERPMMDMGAAENDMFRQDVAEQLLQDPMSRKEMERVWSTFVLPTETIGLKQALKKVCKWDAEADRPSVSLMEALMHVAMEEGSR